MRVKLTSTMLGITIVGFGFVATVAFAQANLGDSLVKAVKSENVGEVSRLLDAGANVDAADEDGSSALEWACIRSNPELATLLISKGAKVTSRDRLGRIPLHEAVGRKRSVELIKLLVTHGSDVNAQETGLREIPGSNHGSTPLWYAARYRPRDILVREDAFDVIA